MEQERTLAKVGVKISPKCLHCGVELRFVCPNCMLYFEAGDDVYCHPPKHYHLKCSIEDQKTKNAKPKY